MELFVRGVGPNCFLRRLVLWLSVNGALLGLLIIHALCPVVLLQEAATLLLVPLHETECNQVLRPVLWCLIRTQCLVGVKILQLILNGRFEIGKDHAILRLRRVSTVFIDYLGVNVLFAGPQPLAQVTVESRGVLPSARHRFRRDLRLSSTRRCLPRRCVRILSLVMRLIAATVGKLDLVRRINFAYLLDLVFDDVVFLDVLRELQLLYRLLRLHVYFSAAQGLAVEEDLFDVRRRCPLRLKQQLPQILVGELLSRQRIAVPLLILQLREHETVLPQRHLLLWFPFGFVFFIITSFFIGIHGVGIRCTRLLRHLLVDGEVGRLFVDLCASNSGSRCLRWCYNILNRLD